MKAAGAILQILPRAPGSRDGVGDYARTLALGLEQTHGYKTTFVPAAPGITPTLRGTSDEQWRQHPATAIVLHYVNYGYHRRGVPFWLPKKLRQIQQLCGGRLITIFHELYASGSWRQSAFWLRPIQKQIARALAKSSAVCIVSSAALGEQLRQLAPTARIVVRPVVSNFGEPILEFGQIAGRDPERWVICGGTELIERSLRSFLRRIQAAEPRELFVVGGADRPAIRQLLREARKISVQYLPDVEVKTASATLASCVFGWIDYFETANVPTGAILKSTAFAALCAHGVIPVFPQSGETIALDGDALPGPFSNQNLPAESERPHIAQAFYKWYERNASSAHLAETLAAVLAE